MISNERNESNEKNERNETKPENIVEYNEPINKVTEKNPETEVKSKSTENPDENKSTILQKILDYDNIVVAAIILIVILLLGYISYRIYDYYLTINVDYTIFDNMGVYYINLDRSHDRRKNIEKMCMEHEIKATRVSAVDGKKLDLNDPKYAKALQKIKWWFLMENRKNVGHFGCYLSHMKIYETFLQTDKEYCLIFEDDAEFITPYLKRDIVHNMNNLPRDWDILLLGYEINGGPDGYKEVREGNKDTKLKNGLLNITYFTGLQGYIINRKCASKFIENLQELDWIIDWNMAYLARKGLINIYGVYPPLVCQPAVHMIQINDINYRYRCKSTFDTLTNK